MKLALTIDVEEEGLFRGRYPAGPAPVENVSRLRVLRPLFSELGIRPTLLVTYPVACSPAHGDLLLQLRDEWGAEIGAHLHPWNTPPMEPRPLPEPVPSESMPRELLRDKLQTLMESLERMGVKPSSFRMGRFNLGPGMLDLLREKAVRVDSSVAPGRAFPGGPRHLTAPSDPYFPDPEDVCIPGGSGILEVPITIVPLIPHAAAFLQAFARSHSIPGTRASTMVQRLLFLPAQPAWIGLRRLKAAVRLHRRRGGKVVTVLLHSSELMPGGYPGRKTEGDLSRFCAKLDRFLSWLRDEIGAEPMTLSDLWSDYAREPHAESKIT
ncbi:MAG: hypothetical protein AB1512_28205 [Thermodesulfobacteriota bacterium]